MGVLFRHGNEFLSEEEILHLLEEEEDAKEEILRSVELGFSPETKNTDMYNRGYDLHPRFIIIIIIIFIMIIPLTIFFY